MANAKQMRIGRAKKKIGELVRSFAEKNYGKDASKKKYQQANLSSMSGYTVQTIASTPGHPQRKKAKGMIGEGYYR